MKEGLRAEIDQGQATLFDRYSDQEVTVRGVTAPLGVLINLCPVPESQMDPVAKEQWTADILTEAGVDLPPEHLSPEIADHLSKKKV